VLDLAEEAELQARIVGIGPLAVGSPGAEARGVRTRARAQCILRRRISVGVVYVPRAWLAHRGFLKRWGMGRRRWGAAGESGSVA
jgi:hypothetical protein